MTLENYLNFPTTKLNHAEEGKLSLHSQDQRIQGLQNEDDHLTSFLDISKKDNSFQNVVTGTEMDSTL